ncbi:class I SAM-dependent methyltransferase [Conexibacter sp. SYSU D00693]|uniref:class I SAM-dependent DNA methyltransferase n=1 Tax=Conexibacter sp. SYSU D00693 TaxID=2812560 RepID=UPI00196A1ED2|nr:class I SAM-dependent methyltransferase [Conexibacter sp. SYSU D00693]
MPDTISRPHPTGRYAIAFPDSNAAADQDAECCDLHGEDGVERVRFHDYAAIYRRPGLYEQLFYEELRCQSPQVVTELLAEQVAAAGVEPSSLRVLDLGAGNGMVGERLARLGVGSVTGIDLLPEAREAAERDRPGVYDAYVVGDLTALEAGAHATLASASPNCLTTVAALGFGDVPPAVFAAAFGFVAIDGWLAMTIKEDFLDADDGSGFAELVRGAVTDGTIELCAQRTYRHRLAADGSELFYSALVARKRGELAT